MASTISTSTAEASTCGMPRPCQSTGLQNGCANLCSMMDFVALMQWRIARSRASDDMITCKIHPVGVNNYNTTQMGGRRAGTRAMFGLRHVVPVAHHLCARSISTSMPATAAMAQDSRRTGVLAIKCGMTREWDAWGVAQPLTVLKVRFPRLSKHLGDAARSC